MSATETIRAMLDERGVEWVDTGDGSTLIPAQAATNVAWDVNTWPSGKDIGGCLWVQNRHPLTPEQAIEATLGRGECEKLPSDGTTRCFVRRYGYEREFGYWKCSACGCECFEGARYCMGCGRKVRE